MRSAIEVLDESNAAGVFLRGHDLNALMSGVLNLSFERASSPVQRRREGCDGAREVVFPKPHPLEKMSVASVKHCSIPAFHVVCCPLTGDALTPYDCEKRSEERDVCHG